MNFFFVFALPFIRFSTKKERKFKLASSIIISILVMLIVMFISILLGGLIIFYPIPIVINHDKRIIKRKNTR